MSAEPDGALLTGEVVRVVRDILGTGAVGAYLHGSAVFGGLKPRSDIDVFVVTRRSLTIN